VKKKNQKPKFFYTKRVSFQRKILTSNHATFVQRATFPGTNPSLSILCSNRKAWRHFSFCTKGCPASRDLELDIFVWPTKVIQISPTCRDVGMSENRGGLGASNNVVGIIYPPPS
jgi:hypothetical protein